MCMSSPSMPAMQAPVEEPKAPTQASDAVKRARAQQETRSRNMSGDASTIATTSRGLLAPVSTGTKTILGG